LESSRRAKTNSCQGRARRHDFDCAGCRSLWQLRLLQKGLKIKPAPGCDNGGTRAYRCSQLNFSMIHQKISLLPAAVSFAAALLFSSASFAADKPATDSAKSTYPLTTCVVSDDKLEGGDMGGPVDYIHKEAGKPDRLVRFCCKDCIKDFKKDPAKYLKKLDEAAAQNAKADSSSHGDHKH
jgi:hypothetical protein